jgi:hypothetical protein
MYVIPVVVNNADLPVMLQGSHHIAYAPTTLSDVPRAFAHTLRQIHEILGGPDHV